MAGLTIYIDDKDLKKAQNGIVVPPRKRSYGTFLNDIIDKKYYEYYNIPDPKKVESVNIQLDFLPQVENATNKGYNADTQTYSIYKSVEDPNSYDVGSGLKISRSANPELFNIINSQNGNNKYITKEQHDELLKRRVEKDYENSKRIYNNHINKSFGVINAWDNLTPEERSLLMDYEYNSKGGLSQYPKFMTAMYKKDIDNLKKESKRYMVTQWKKLELGRNKHILNRIENIYDNRQQFGGPTHLQPWDEQRFRMWFNTLPEGIRNSNDYDYRGWWLENGSIPYKNGVHFTDKFKLPNHPTFSEESIYSKGNTEGGYWVKDGFVPSPYNTRNGSDRIIDYMEFAEPKGTMMFDTNGMVATFQNGGPKRRLKDNFNKFTKEELDFISNNWNTGQTFTDGEFVYVMPGDTASNLHNRNVKQTLFDNGLPRSNASMVSTSNGWKISHAMDERYAGNEGRSWDNYIVKYYIGDNKDLIPQNAQYITVDENGNYVLNNGVPRLNDGGQTGMTIIIDDEQFKKGGQIHIKEKNKGKFTAKAKAAGMSVQEFARKVLSDKNKNKYSASTRRQANFARNASKWGK